MAAIVRLVLCVSSGKAVLEVIKASEQGGHVPYRNSVVTRLLQVRLVQTYSSAVCVSYLLYYYYTKVC